MEFKQPSQVVITGYSDDMISITGAIDYDFGVYECPNNVVVLSTGTMIKAVYDDDGIWRFTVRANGRAHITKTEGNVDQDTFDSLSIIGERNELTWAVLSKEEVLVKVYNNERE